MSEEKPKVSPVGASGVLLGCDGTFDSCHCLDVQRKMAWFARFSESAQCVFPQMNERPRIHAFSQQLFLENAGVQEITSH